MEVPVQFSTNPIDIGIKSIYSVHLTENQYSHTEEHFIANRNYIKIMRKNIK